MAAPGRTLTVYLATDTKKAQAGMAGFMSDMKKMAGAAAIAGAAIAVKLGVDGVQAAAAAQVQVQKLESQLTALGKEAESAGLQQWIDDLQFATGVSEDELYPALQKLLGATGDVAEAQKALGLAMDISAQGGKSLDAAATGLSKAYQGNVTALGKLTPELDKAYLKTASVEEATQRLTDLYGGAAAAQAETYQGTVNKLTIGMGELQESFGTGFLEGFTDALGDGAGGTDDLADAIRDLQPQLEAIGETVGQLGGDLIKLVGWLAQTYQAVVDLGGSDNSALAALGNTFSALTNPLGTFMSGLDAVQAELAQTRQDAWRTAQETNAALSDFATGDFGGGNFGGGQAAAWTSGYVRQMEMANEASARAKKAAAAAAKAAKEAAKSFSGGSSGGGGGSLASAVDEVTAADKRLAKESQRLQGTLDDQLAGLDAAQQAWTDLAAAADDYSKSIADAITQNISLSDALKAQQDDQAKEAGEQTGVTWLQAFRQQLADASAFSAALKGLANAPGVSQAFVDQVAGVAGSAGVPAATELVNGLMSQDGLPGQLSSELEAVMAESGAVGSVFASTFYAAGLASAQDTVNGWATGVAESQKKLKAVGKAMGEPIAESMVDTINKALQAAWDSWKQTTTWTQGSSSPGQLRAVGGTATRSTPAPIQVTVNGAVDPVGTAKAIRRVLAKADLRTGVGI